MREESINALLHPSSRRRREEAGKEQEQEQEQEDQEGSIETVVSGVHTDLFGVQHVNLEQTVGGKVSFLFNVFFFF